MIAEEALTLVPTVLVGGLVINFLFAVPSWTRRKALFSSFAVIAALLSAKLYVDVQNKPINYYYVLDVPRYASMTEIRTAFKEASIRVHPDKKRSSDSSEFELVKRAYDVSGKQANGAMCEP